MTKAELRGAMAPGREQSSHAFAAIIRLRGVMAPGRKPVSQAFAANIALQEGGM